MDAENNEGDETRSRCENHTVAPLVARPRRGNDENDKNCSVIRRWVDTAVGAFDLQCGRRGQARAGSSSRILEAEMQWPEAEGDQFPSSVAAEWRHCWLSPTCLYLFCWWCHRDARAPRFIPDTHSARTPPLSRSELKSGLFLEPKATGLSLKEPPYPH